MIYRTVSNRTSSMDIASTSRIILAEGAFNLRKLCWIHNNKPWKQFVRNRVAQIHGLTNREIWRYCPGTQNPTDLPSHGLGGKDLAQNHLWWEGPEFMTSDSISGQRTFLAKIARSTKLSVKL